ncbi:MAG: hypothetical protein ABUL44_02395 [Flavobacterium sp.]
MTKIFEQVGQIKVKSITDSIFRYALLILLLGTIAPAFKTEKWILIVLFSLGGLMVVVGIIVFSIFSKKNPDYLRSENYQLKKQSIELLGNKDNALNPHVDKVVNITSPYNTDEDGKNKLID